MHVVWTHAMNKTISTRGFLLNLTHYQSTPTSDSGFGGGGGRGGRRKKRKKRRGRGRGMGRGRENIIKQELK